MAYSAPELLLIGAAQHLVLETSSILGPIKESQVEHEFCRTVAIEDAPLEYDGGSSW